MYLPKFIGVKLFYVKYSFESEERLKNVCITTTGAAEHKSFYWTNLKVMEAHFKML